MDSRGETMEYVRLNIGGTIFKCYRKTLSTFQESKLNRLDKDNDDFDNELNEYYFDRNPLLFAYIIDAFRKGEVHLPNDICGTTFKEELEFWNIPLDKVAPCCLEALYRSKDDIDTVQKLITYEQETSDALGELERNKTSLRAKLWQFLDNPNSSKVATVWSTVMALLVVASTFTDALSTVSTFQQNYTESEMRSLNLVAELLNRDNKTIEIISTKKPEDILMYIIVACHIILTLEFVLCFVVCINKRSYMLCFTRMSTLVGYTSFWVVYFIHINLQYIESGIVVSLYMVFAYLQIAKLARLFYFTKRIPAFAIMGLTFRSSIHEFKVLAFLLGIFVTIFGNFMYSVEFINNPKISNILEGIYWALITVTTVGYGDYVPQTVFGQVIASICAVTGILVIALPVGIIASNFYKLYNFCGYTKTHFETLKEGPVTQSLNTIESDS